MEVIGSPKPCNEVDAEGLAIAVFKDEKANNGLLKTLDAALGGMIADVIESEEFTAKQGETAYFHVSSKSLKARRVLLIGCGAVCDSVPWSRLVPGTGFPQSNGATSLIDLLTGRCTHLVRLNRERVRQLSVA